MKKTYKIAIASAALLAAFAAVFFIADNMREAERQRKIEDRLALEAERQKEYETYLSLEPGSKISLTMEELGEFRVRLFTGLAAGEYTPGDTDTSYLDGILASSGDGLFADYLEIDDDWENIDFAYHSETERYVIRYRTYSNWDKIPFSYAIKTIIVGEGEDERTYVNFNNQETAKNPPESWLAEQILNFEKQFAEPEPISEAEIEPAPKPPETYSYYPVFERIKEIEIGDGYGGEPVYILSGEEREKLWSLMRTDEWVVATDLDRPGTGRLSKFFINEKELVKGEQKWVQTWFFNQYYEEQALIIPSSPPQGGVKTCYFAPADVITDILAYTETLTPQQNP